MSILDGILSSTTPSAPKGIVYGPPGIGKSTFGAKAPGSFIIDCENGVGAIQCRSSGYLATWPEIEKWILAVERDRHDYGVLVVDSVDWLMRRMEEHVTGIKGGIDQTLNKSHGGYGNGKQVLKNYVYQKLLPTLDHIVGRGIAVVLLAHEKRTDITNSDGVTIEKTTADLSPDYLNTFIEWSDFMCHARYGANGERVLVTAETPQALAKNRYNLPPVLPFDWPSFVSAISSGLAAKFSNCPTQAVV